MQECKGEVKCNVGAKRLWRAGFEDAHNCLPKAVPNVITHIEYEGDGFQPGSFRIVHYQPGYAKYVSKENSLDHLVKYTKEKMLEIDDDSLKLKYEVVRGGFLGIMVTQYTYTIQIVEGSLPDTCVIKWSYQYIPISPKHHAMMCARLKEILPLSFKSLESYLLVNDDYRD